MLRRIVRQSASPAVIVAAALSVAQANAAMAQHPATLATSAADRAIALGPGSTRIPLVSTDRTDSLAAGVEALAPGTRVYLRLLNLNAAAAPGVTYNVYLNAPVEQPPGGPTDPHYLGSFSFFDAGVRDRGVAINVTDRLRQLRADGKLDSPPTITVAPSGQPSKDAAPEIGRIVLTIE